MRFLLPSSALLFVLASGCGSEASSTGTGGSASTTGTSTTTSSAGGAGGGGGARPTPPPLPLIPNQGGPVIAQPEIVTITWKGDPIEADLLAFDEWMVKSSFFSTMMAEWGVGAGTHGGSLSMATPAPATLDDSAIHSLLQDAITQGTVPPADGSRIYTVYPPPGTVVTSFGAEGCSAFQAYHSSFVATLPGGGTALAVYAVTPRCAQTQGLSSTDYTTWGASHEVMEASSDPDGSSPAWVILKQTPETPELGENADLCTGHPTRIEGHLVTRNYSNVAAKAGERPCVPAPAGPMFGAFTSPGEVSVPAGGSVTVPLYLYADGPLGAFDVEVLGLDPKLTASIDQSSGQDGDTLSLTIQASATYAEIPGQNLVRIASVSAGYPTYRFVIVHRQK
jgi:hypothetical protein